MEKHGVRSRDSMLGRKRFLILLVVGGVTLAIITLRFQFCECTNIPCISCLVVEQNTICMSSNGLNHLPLQPCGCPELSRGPLGAPAPPPPPPVCGSALTGAVEVFVLEVLWDEFKETPLSRLALVLVHMRRRRNIS